MTDPSDPNYGRQLHMPLPGAGPKRKPGQFDHQQWKRQLRQQRAMEYLANAIDWPDDPVPYPTDYYPSADHP